MVHITSRGWRERKVNYNIANNFFSSFLNLNKFFINGVTEISTYQYLRRDGGEEGGVAKITDSFTQFHNLISDLAFGIKINFLGYLIDQKQVIAEDANPSRHNEISRCHSQRIDCASLSKWRHITQTEMQFCMGSPSSAVS